MRASRAVLVAAAVAVGVLIMGGVAWAVVAVLEGEPDSVQEVADAAVDAAEDLDLDAGVRLLCEPPDAEQRAEVEDLIAESRDRAGTDDPEVDYELSDVEGDDTGRFLVKISSPEEGLAGEGVVLEVQVETDGDRSCIQDADRVDLDG